MMPDLDRYAGTVLGAYGVTVVLVGALVAMSWWRAAKVAGALARIEARLRGESGGKA